MRRYMLLVKVLSLDLDSNLIMKSCFHGVSSPVRKRRTAQVATLSSTACKSQLERAALWCPPSGLKSVHVSVCLCALCPDCPLDLSQPAGKSGCRVAASTECPLSNHSLRLVAALSLGRMTVVGHTSFCL